MVGVDPAAVLAGSERLDTGIEFVEHDGEVPGVPAGRVEPEPNGAQISGADEGEGLEPHEWHLLGELVNGRVASGEHRDPVLAVDVVVPLGIGPQRNSIQRATADDDGLIVIEPVTFSDVSLLGHLWLTAVQRCRAWS